MKKWLIIALFFVSSPVFATNSYLVSTGGQSGIEGCYIDDNRSANGSIVYVLGTSYMLARHANAYAGLDSYLGSVPGVHNYYYSSLGGGGNYEDIDTTNEGASPVPTVTLFTTSDCSSPLPPVATSTASSSLQSIQQSMAIFFAFCLTFMSIIFFGFVFNRIKR
jgi:hypothetical protein